MPQTWFAQNIEFQYENFPDFEFYAPGLTFAKGGGLTLLPDQLSGIVRMSFGAGWWINGTITIDCLPVSDGGSGKAQFVIEYNGKFYAYNSQLPTPAWVPYDTCESVAAWSDMSALAFVNSAGSPFAINGANSIEFMLYIKLSRSSVDDESPLLTRAAVLYSCMVTNYGAYINQKLSDYFKALTFYGRVTITATSTSDSNGRQCIPKSQIPIFSSGYNNATLVAIYKKSQPNISILSSVEADEWVLTPGSTLNNELIDCEFTYNISFIASQSIDMIQIEKFPVIIASEWTEPISLMQPSEEYYYNINDPDHSVLVGVCPGVGQQKFTAEILTDLYYDTLEIVNKLAQGVPMCLTGSFDTVIPLPEVGQEMVLSVDGEPTETTVFGNTSGNKVLELKMKLVFPFPIPRLTVAKKAYTGLALDAKLSGG
jgi:hypothetical protein